MSVLSKVSYNLRSLLDASTNLLSSFENLEKSLEDPSDLIEKITEADERLQSSIGELKKHQEFQKHIIELREKISDRECDVMDLATLLLKAQTVLQQRLDFVSRDLEMIRKLSVLHDTISVDDIVKYSKRVSATAGRIPLPPPAPGGPPKGLFLKLHYPEQFYMPTTRIQYDTSKAETVVTTEESTVNSAFLSLIESHQQAASLKSLEEMGEFDLTLF